MKDEEEMVLRDGSVLYLNKSGRNRERKVEEIDFEVDRSGLIDIAVCRKRDLEIEIQTFMDVIYFSLLSG